MKSSQPSRFKDGIEQSEGSSGFVSARRIYGAAFICLATAVAGVAQTGKVTQILGLVPPAVANGVAVAAGQFRSDQMLRLALGLQHPHPADEEQFVVDLHTKGSPRFMHFLTADQWNAQFSPSEQDEQAVVDWAQAQGLTVTQRFANRLVVDVEAPVSAIEAALGVKINSYALQGVSYYSNDRNPAVPAALGSIVHSIGGLNNIQAAKHGNHGFAEPVFPVYSQGLTKSTGQSGSDAGDSTKLAGAPLLTNNAYNPVALYGSEAYDSNALDALGHCCNPLGNPNASPVETSIAIVSFGKVNGADITGFHNTYPYLADNWQQFYIDGTPTTPDVEGTLDMEWSTAMANSFGAAANTAKVYIYDGANPNPSTVTDAYNYALSDGYARVFSTSWGLAEVDGISQPDMDTDHGIFNAMIGQGWTLVSISGDWGATSWGTTSGSSEGCVPHLAVTYPGSDPNMVSAGGSSLTLGNGLSFSEEFAWVAGPSGCAADDGGSGGGTSAYYAAPSYQGLPIGAKRQVPDIALNADGDTRPQNFYFGGILSPAGGTSIVAPEVAGFFAQANAYMLYVGAFTGGCSAGGCAPIGNGGWYLYVFGLQPKLAPHYPFYDIMSGCNNNDVTEAHNLTAFCAGPGRDQVTGWGSFNFLQLAWAINFDLVGDFGVPMANFSGPALNKWYNNNQVVSWSIYDTAEPGKEITGVAGFSQAWDTDPGGDPTSAMSPGSGNSFYSGPQFPNKTSGCLDFAGSSCSAAVGQGWHTVNVRAWDNTGIPNYFHYGPIGYDTVPPQTTGQASTANPAQITLTATDATSGVAGTVYQLDGGPTTTYGGPFLVSAPGGHVLTFHSTDVAGNVESNETLTFAVGANTPTITLVTNNVAPLQLNQSITFTVAVSSANGPPTGTVTFFDGSSQMGVCALSAGKATLPPTILAVGTHTITAAYSGSAGFAPSTSPAFTQTVVGASTSTTLTSTPNPSTIFSRVTLTATVTGGFPSPSGIVTFLNGTTVLGTGSVDTATRKATYSPTFIASGTYSIQAVYGGNADSSPSTSPALKQVVH